MKAAVTAPISLALPIDRTSRPSPSRRRVRPTLPLAQLRPKAIAVGRRAAVERRKVPRPQARRLVSLMDRHSAIEGRPQKERHIPLARRRPLAVVEIDT